MMNAFCLVTVNVKVLWRKIALCSEAFSSFLEGMLSSFVATYHICEELGLLAGY